MKRIIYVILLISINSYSQELIFSWKNVIGNTGHTIGLTIDLDSLGYIYVAGSSGNYYYQDELNLKSNYSKDGFLIKYDSLGNLIWEKRFKCLYDCSVSSIKIKNDNLIVLGYYKNKVQFDTILVTNNLDTLISSNMFICNYNLDGELVWAKNTGGVSYSGHKLCIASNNNIFITGKSVDIIFFDTTSTVVTLDSIWEITPWGSYWRYFHPEESFLAKYDSNGNKIWIKNIGGNPFYNYLDFDSNIIISGNYSGTVTFDSIDLESLGTRTIYLAKYDIDGKIMWVRRAGGSSNWNVGKGIVIDYDNNIYQTGEMSGNDITFGEEMISNFESTSGFIAKYNQMGDFLWVKQIGLAYNEGGTGNFIRGNSIRIDSQGDINLTGYFQGTIYINDHSLISSGWHDLMLLRYDTNGNVITGGQFTNKGWSAGNDLTIGKDGNFFITGYTYLDASSSNSPQYALIAKVDKSIPVDPLSLQENDQFINQITIFPNPTHGKLALNISNENCSEIRNISIYNMFGEKLYNFNKADMIQNLIIHEKGTYLIQIIVNNEFITKKLVVY